MTKNLNNENKYLEYVLNKAISLDSQLNLHFLRSMSKAAIDMSEWSCIALTLIVVL